MPTLVCCFAFLTALACCTGHRFAAEARPRICAHDSFQFRAVLATELGAPVTYTTARDAQL